MSDQDRYQEGFEEGRRVGRLDAFGPRGIPRSHLLPGAEYRFRVSHFDSFVDYEKQVLANLRHLQMQRWGREEESELECLEGEVRGELRRAREAVDSEVERGRDRPQLLTALRATPQVPGSVREYRDAGEFLREDPRRGSEAEDGSIELGGADFGGRWSLEHPFRRWLTTRWRVSWLCDFTSGRDDLHSEGEATREIYAVEFLDRRPRAQPPRVWLLGRLNTWEVVERALGDWIWEAIDERNSLIAAADAVAQVQREEEDETRD